MSLQDHRQSHRDRAEVSDEQPLPSVPDVDDPQPDTPLTEEFTTGTANDPDPAGADGRTTVTVDGRAVTVDDGATILEAVEAAGADDDVPALCHYEGSEEIGPRSTCRTCVVDTDEHGIVPACSHPAEEGLEVRTDEEEAAEARDVNLDLVLSNHNLRCTTCGQNGRCELQDTAIENEVEEPRYGVFDDREEYEPLDDTSPFIQIDRNKCILCNRCVEACNDVQVEGVLRIEGTGEDTRIAFQNDAEAMVDSACVSCGHCATVCPTGSITEKGLADSATLPVPGFTQKNSIGKTVDPEDAGDPVEPDDSELSGVAGVMERAKRQATETVRNAGERALLEAEHAGESVAASILSEGQMFDIAEFVADRRLDDLDVTETTCGYCSVGCRFDVYTDDEEVLGVRPTDADHAPANDGFSTCVKGKFGYDFVDSEDRLEQPLVRDRESGELREAGWEEALERLVDGLTGIREEHGADALACFASSKCTNEENYLLQKFARQVLGTKNVDNCARLCHSSTVAALKQTVGYGAMTNRIEDVANADCYLITGSNTTESHPVLATRIKQNVRDGADLFVFDPRRVGIAEHADQYTRVEPGYDVAWINGLTRYVLEHDLHDEAFVAERTKNLEELREKVEPFTPAEVERLCGVAPDELANAAETIATADSCVFGWAMGMTQHSHGTQNVLALANLALVTGHIGKPNSGLSPFRGHNNVQGGGGDMGTLPNSLPGYQPVDDPDVLEVFEEAWGDRPPSEPGLTVPEVFDEAHEGAVRGMYVMGENPALSEPDIDHAEAALEELDFLVVQDIFPTETAEHADVVLPAASFAEKDGTFTNTERRVQLVRQALSPPGEARQDWQILQTIANRLGYDWSYDAPAEIMDEISDLAPIYGGISHERLEREGGLQWPCRDADDPGTPYLYDEAFNFDDGKARFVPADLGEPGELPDEEYPLTLTTGRVLYHFHTGTLTRRVEGIMSHVGESFVEVHPETAAQLGVADGEDVRLESRRGSIEVTAQVTDRPDRGVVFMPMHFADGAVNELTQETFDPISGIPEFKISSVRLEAASGMATPADD
ncbi:formate dehydrogenase subunit alpha [Natronococcus occultus]|uniref:Formate dehydrogenase, alpha subunit, archaeal-type n=1 Tax=Natronococcus occultus SP4 TaxID=694430 RepID=L0JWW3_9EURY|nr:formate dehydrogenase subunit alpha [Natronococcus occultus]AGB36609.1 formate dehydrogenase, alpha subunit, archaeal-type [Natronococcus occultus SP4]